MYWVDGDFLDYLNVAAHRQAGTLQVMNTSHNQSQACEDRDFSEWHQGCPWCAVWVVLIKSEALNATVHAARHALGDALLARYERQPHLTLAYRGLCDASQHAAAEFNPERLQDDLATLQALAQPPFPTSPSLEPLRYEKPEPGKLVQYPTYMWHGTVPFTGDETRLTIAFDVVPA